MSALTVTLGADITSLKRAMAGATELVGLTFLSDEAAEALSKFQGSLRLDGINKPRH